MLSMKAWKETELRLKKIVTIDVSHERVISKEKEYLKDVLKRIMSVVKTLAISNLAFCGGNEKIDDCNNGNFLRIIKMIAEFDPIMQEHLRRIRKKGIRRPCLGIVGEEVPRMSGVVKMDLEMECEVSTRFYGGGRYGGEPLFVPRNATQDHLNSDVDDEDDGFVVTYIHDENSGESKFIVMDANSPCLDIVAAVKLPSRVPYGFHGLVVHQDHFSNNPKTLSG
ncbi:hypothetical protein EZV62_002077 [Acer yangbiense]|uniref:Carotenoid oxygenase n=1 Tax=Acer yangbiense TaxID=1000413 RepID=A0A5C7IWM2_9ROSI|nr:hypothetical protein EZV62_002077 [Acer yangbiense]